jgi:hypothetical protein
VLVDLRFLIILRVYYKHEGKKKKRKKK